MQIDNMIYAHEPYFEVYLRRKSIYGTHLLNLLKHSFLISETYLFMAFRDFLPIIYSHTRECV